MTDSQITGVINDLSGATVWAIIVGSIGYGVGYLGAHAVAYLGSSLQIDPRIGLAAGGVIGATFSLSTFNKEASPENKIIGLAALIFAPFHICKRYEIPVTFKAVAAVTTATTLATLMIFWTISKFSTSGET